MEISELKTVGVQLCVKYVLPLLKKIAASAISKIGKSTYEKLYSKLTDALESFEKALKKCLETDDVSKLKKHITCCRLGYKFFEKMKNTLNGVLENYSNSLNDAYKKYEELGGNLEDFEGV